jgi:hypothetical protein
MYWMIWFEPFWVTLMCVPLPPETDASSHAQPQPDHVLAHPSLDGGLDALLADAPEVAAIGEATGDAGGALGPTSEILNEVGKSCAGALGS